MSAWDFRETPHGALIKLTRQRAFDIPACDDFTFRDMAELLFKENYRGGFGVTGLVRERTEQSLLFEETGILRQRKRERLSRAVDALRNAGIGGVDFGTDARSE